MQYDHPANGPSGFVCPHCGGALWEHRDGTSASFACRIGDRFAQADLWIEHYVARNRALVRAARSLAENAALARRLGVWTDTARSGPVGRSGAVRGWRCTAADR